jgi:alpha-1,3-glucan synthase
LPHGKSVPPPVRSTPPSRSTRSSEANSPQAHSVCSNHSKNLGSRNAHTKNGQSTRSSPRTTGHFNLASERNSFSDEDKTYACTSRQPGLSYPKSTIQPNHNQPDINDLQGQDMQNAKPDYQLDSPIVATSGMNTPTGSCADDAQLNPPLSNRHHVPSDLSLLSIETIVQEKEDYNLQKVNPFFTDPKREYAKNFESKLANLNGKNSENRLSIDEYISKSEKEWFKRYRHAKLGKSPASTPASSIFRLKVNKNNKNHNRNRNSCDNGSNNNKYHSGDEDDDNNSHRYNDNDNHHSTPLSPSRSTDEAKSGEFRLPTGYKPPSGLKRFLLLKIGDWPLYALLLAFVGPYELCSRTCLTVA